MVDLHIKNWPKQCFGGFWIRFFAFIIDSILIKALSKIILNLTAHQFLAPSLAQGVWWYELLKLALFVGYFALTMYVLQGQTPGKYLLNLKVLTNEGLDLDLQTLLVREIAGRAILFYLPIVYLSLLITGQRQHFLDILCDTRVVNLKQVQALKNAQENKLIIPDALQEKLEPQA